MSDTHIENRTLGELAAMRDTLNVARQDLERASLPGKAIGLVLCIDGMLRVLTSIVEATPFYSNSRVRDRVAYKG